MIQNFQGLINRKIIVLREGLFMNDYVQKDGLSKLTSNLSDFDRLWFVTITEDAHIL